MYPEVSGLAAWS